MVKLLPFRFQQCFGAFTMLLVDGSSETGLFIHLTKHVFWSLSVQKYSARTVIFFLKMFKIESKCRKNKKNWEKVFRFSDNSIWKCCNKLPLLRRQYFSSALNGLTNSPKILHITQRVFFKPNLFKGINIYGKGALVELSTVFRLVYLITCQSVLLNGLLRHLSSHFLGFR